jgi:hypothetical protein
MHRIALAAQLVEHQRHVQRGLAHDQVGDQSVELDRLDMQFLMAAGAASARSR